MKSDEARRRLRRALQAEEERAKARLDATNDGRSDAAVIDEPPPPSEPPCQAHVESIKARYRKIGFDPTPEQIIDAGLCALDELPGSVLRKLMEAVTGAGKGR